MRTGSARQPRLSRDFRLWIAASSHCTRARGAASSKRRVPFGLEESSKRVALDSSFSSSSSPGPALALEVGPAEDMPSPSIISKPPPASVPPLWPPTPSPPPWRGELLQLSALSALAAHVYMHLRLSTAARKMWITAPALSSRTRRLGVRFPRRAVCQPLTPPAAPEPLHVPARARMSYPRTVWSAHQMSPSTSAPLLAGRAAPQR